MESFPSCFLLFLSESASLGTALFRRPSWAALLSGLRGLRFVLPFSFRGPGAVSLGHTGSLLGYSEEEVLFPGGSKVMVKELLRACLFFKGAVNSTQPKKPQRGGASRPGPNTIPIEEPQGQSPLRGGTVHYFQSTAQPQVSHWSGAGLKLWLVSLCRVGGGGRPVTT